LAKFNDLEKKEIVADYINCQNYSEVARKWNVSAEAIRLIVKASKDNVLEKLENKKIENTQTTLEYMQTQHETKKRILNKLLKGIEIKADDINELTSIKDLATAYGIILDKELKVLEIQKQQMETKSNGVLDDLMEALKNVKGTKQ
jgi:transposase-like protein